MKHLDLATKIAMGTLHEKKNSFFGGVGLRTDGSIVISTNLRVADKTHPAHCEVRLLKKCDVGSTIFLVRLTRDGQWAMSRPCKKCQALIKNRRVKKVVFTVGPGEFSVWEP